jgi:hypothetical protein
MKRITCVPEAPEMLPALLAIGGTFPANVDMNRPSYPDYIMFVSAVSHLFFVNGMN